VLFVARKVAWCWELLDHAVIVRDCAESIKGSNSKLSVARGQHQLEGNDIVIGDERLHRVTGRDNQKRIGQGDKRSPGKHSEY
jgi:hypothetical protein